MGPIKFCFLSPDRHTVIHWSLIQHHFLKQSLTQIQFCWFWAVFFLLCFTEHPIHISQKSWSIWTSFCICKLSIAMEPTKSVKFKSLYCLQFVRFFFSIKCEIKCNMYAHLFVCKCCQFHGILEKLELISWFADKKWLFETDNWCSKQQAKAHVSRTGFHQNWCPTLCAIAHYLNLHIFLTIFTPVLLLCQLTCTHKNISQNCM